MKRFLAIILVLVLSLSLLAGCGSETTSSTAAESSASAGESSGEPSSESSGESSDAAVAPDAEYTEITDYIVATTREISTFNILNTSTARNFKFLTNLTEPLLNVDPHGTLIPGLAEDYSVSEDGLTYTFNIREGATWVDYQGNYKADVVAEDWLYGLEWVLNFWKNESYNTSMAFGIIEGAQEYYDYTTTLDESEAIALGLDTFLETVGIEAPDDHTLVYHLVQPTAYFPSVTTSPTYYPLSKGQVDELGVAGFRAVTNETLWYCGPYTVTSFAQDNEKVLSANPAYWDTSAKLFNTVTYKQVESADVAYQLYQNGEAHDAALSTSAIATISSDPTNPYHDYLVLSTESSVVWCLYFNYAKNNTDGTPDTNWNLAAANEAFRKCFYSVDYTNYFAASFSTLDPLAIQVFTVSCNNLTTFSDGSDYTSRVRELIGLEPQDDVYVRYDADGIAAYKAQAIEELTAQGVSFPVTVDLWCSSDQDTIDQVTVLKECLEDSLGTDFITVNINTYITSLSQEVTTPSYQSFILDGSGANYADPMSFLTQNCTDIGDAAQFAVVDGNIFDSPSQELIDLYNEYTELVRAADAIIGDNDARLEALAEAEAFSLEHALIIPLRSNRSYSLTCADPYFKPTNTNDYLSVRYINWRTNADGWTAAEIEASRAAYLAGN